MCATVTAPSAAVVDPNFGVCLASAPLGFADLHQIPLCSALGNNFAFCVALSQLEHYHMAKA